MPLYAFGSNGSGQLGIGHRDDVQTPCRHIGPANLNIARPKQIAAGGNHTLVLYESGQLACTPATHTGSENESRETKILAHNVRLCSATWECFTYCTCNNTLYSWGTSQKGELGQGQDRTEIAAPGTTLDIPVLKHSSASIVDLASGVQHTVVVLSTGEVLGWGNGRKGQLGEPAEIIRTPRRIAGLPFKVSRAVCGREFTYLVADPTDGRHLILGSDKWLVKSQAPQNVSQWKDIGASWGSIFVLLDSGNIISWGRNDHGQLAPLALEEVHKIAIGSEHALVVAGTDRSVYIWGWGEHGNCGQVIDKDGDVKDGRSNKIVLPSDEEDMRIHGVGAGCATSWIWTKVL